jgi:isochorismate synthase
VLLFRLPNLDNFYTVNDHLPSNNYSIHSFDGEKIIDISGSISEISEHDLEKINFQLPTFNKEIIVESKEEYLKKIIKTIDCIKENNLQKLVIARKKVIQYRTINCTKSFLNLCNYYPNAFVYIFYENGICWMGAFSESLGIYNKNTQQFSTMSLAGTLPIDEKWTSKEIDEQLPVTDFINSVLKKFSNKVTISETYDHISGNIKHLRTDFQIHTKPENIGTILQLLHPTPAVCGIPKDFCKEKIAELEGFDREFYAGYTKLETHDFIYSFVNLRCGKFYENTAELFVGGGITKDSIPEKEWKETELKSLAILNNLLIEN